ncbi:kinase-like domain-containing protein [Talaromyces proteolyticus]|uniref:Kinase-like domain-containing protein n=1 Tax=Talaromyces proteolyticus TaxID=1131652 RepID=A0AAD4KH24_9EURO|nr:kinase-like domain-containing protein [Talaromyces proteolyticus]KAH8690202.1 kinase-like domain-containing protein [Talaromyces proteolyticus]
MLTPEARRQTVGSETPSRSLLSAELQSRTRASTSVQPTPDAACNVPQSPTSSPWTGQIAMQHQPGRHPSPALHLRTDLPTTIDGTPTTPLNDHETQLLRHSLSTASLPRRTPSWAIRMRTLSSAGSLSPSSVRSSAISSPALAAMADITPLPSPIGYLSPSPWRLGGRTISSHSLSRTSSTISRSGSVNLRPSDSHQLLRTASSRSRSRRYSSHRLNDGDVREPGPRHNEDTRRHSRNRSLSEYIPYKAVIPHPRPNAVQGPGSSMESSSSTSDLASDTNNLHREQYLAVQRGLAHPGARPPTPPRSTQSGEDEVRFRPIVKHELMHGSHDEMYYVRSIRTKQPRKYRKLRQLGQGTFSQVSLAVRVPDDAPGKDGHVRMPSLMSQKLVAVKIIEYGPAGGADEDRVEVSLKREVEILKSINHPSLVQLKAFGSDERRALLVLDYCPGGDLFDFATSAKQTLSPPLIRRIFAELVAAVRYLHANYIVHRDIKLENVLVNPPAAAMEQVLDWRTYDRAVITLSDLGLSRRIPEPPESPLLHTRCGSEDYAAPEILMGQPYDGRSTDAWALGVLLYAMMESRLPFDVLPGTRGDPEKLRARTPHRIARCEWSWYRYADEDEEWDPVKGRELEGARKCVEGLLKRHSRRKPLDEIAQLPYVSDALALDGELKRGDKEVP